MLAAEVGTPARIAIADKLETGIVALLEDLSQYVATEASLVRQLFVRAENALDFFRFGLEAWLIVFLLLLLRWLLIIKVKIDLLDEVDKLRVHGCSSAKWHAVAEEVLVDAAVCSRDRLCLTLASHRLLLDFLWLCIDRVRVVDRLVCFCRRRADPLVRASVFANRHQIHA